MEQASRLGSRTQFYSPHLESHCTRFSRWYQYYGLLRGVPLYTTIWHHIQKAVILVSTNMWSSHAPAHQNLSDALLGKERDEQLKHSVTTAAESGFGPRWKKFSLPSKSGLNKDLSNKSEGLALSWRETWAWSGKVNWYNRQIMLLPGKTKILLHAT